MSEDQTDDQADDEKAAGADSPAPSTMTDVDKSGVEDATTSDVPPQQVWPPTQFPLFAFFVKEMIDLPPG